MLGDILKIAALCVVIGSASIPLSFNVNASPVIVWLGNALGSLFSALVVIYISERITSPGFKKRLAHSRPGRKIVKVFDAGETNKEFKKASGFINRHGLRIFSFLCPIFPGVLISTAVVYLLDLDKRLYKRWVTAGIFFVSGAYVFGYWWIFVK